MRRVSEAWDDAFAFVESVGRSALSESAALWTEARGTGAAAESARHRLVLANLPLVLKVVRDRRWTPYPDTFQSGLLGLLGAVARYDPSRGSFSTYAYACIVCAIRADRYGSYLRSDDRLLGVAPAVAVSSAVDGGYDAVDRADAGAFVRAQVAALPARECAVLTLRYGLDGGGRRTLDEVGRALDPVVSAERVRQIEASAKGRLAGRLTRRARREVA